MVIHINKDKETENNDFSETSVQIEFTQVVNRFWV